MNRSLSYIILPLLALLALASCSERENFGPESEKMGLLALNFGYEPVVEAKADPSGEPVFMVTITSVTTGKVVKTIEDHTTIGTEPIYLPEGEYTVTASSGTDVEAAFNAPYYTDSEVVNIVVNETSTVNLHCTLANVKVTVSVSEAVVANFSDYSVSVTNGAPSGVLIFHGDTFASEGYFRCTGTLVWTINLTNTDGKSYEVSNHITNVAPRDYYNIHFDVDGKGSITEQGASSIKVTIDGTVNQKEHLIDISLDKLPMPTVAENTGLALDHTISVPQHAGVVGLFNATVPAGVASVTLTHNSPVMQALGLPYSVTLEQDNGQAYASCGLTWSGVSEGATAFQVDMRTLFAQHLELGTYEMVLNILDKQNQYVSANLSVKIIPDVEVSTVRVNPWAKSAYVYAQYNTEAEPEGMGFQWRASSQSAWTDFTGEIVRDGVSYHAVITGLEPSTEYQVRAVSALSKTDDNILTFTTEAAAQLPNFNFDSWTDSGHFPNADKADNYFWDTGNSGTSTLSKYPTSQETSHVVSGSAAKLESQFVGIGSLGKFAGGNLYTGAFVELVGMNGAKIDFGRPYTSRPASLHGWYSYSPASINYSQAPYTGLNGSSDICQIYVALTDWTGPFRVNNAEGTLFDPNDPSVIAYGVLEDNVGTGGQYKEFTIDIEYRDLERRPTYVLIVATASKYADYFTGGTGSILYIDEFEFVFE